jgi:hypothetical protein
MSSTGSPAATAPQLDVIVDGTWVIIPAVDVNGNIVAVEVYSPSCGHPHGVGFVPMLNPDPWPSPYSFYLLDEHSHTLSIQRASGSAAGMPVSGINRAINHCLAAGRRMAGNWDLMFTIDIGPDAWNSSDTITPQTTDPFGNTVPCLSGADIPTGQVSGLQTLSFYGVTAAALIGAPSAVQALLPTNWTTSGSLIFEGEVPYIPTINHERSAFTAMANLCGMDLALTYPLPPKNSAGSSPVRPQPRIHTAVDCGYSVLVLP